MGRININNGTSPVVASQGGGGRINIGSETKIVNPKIAQYQLEADIANREADIANREAEKENSFWGVFKNIITGLPKAYAKVDKAGKDFAVGIAQGIARTVGTVGTTAGNVPAQIANKTFFKNNPQELPFDQSIETSGSKVGEFVFGGKPINTVQKQIVNTKEFLKPYIGEKGANISSLPLVLGAIAMDLSGFGGPKAVKSFVSGEIPEQFFKWAAKEKIPQKIEEGLIKIGVDPIRAKALARPLADTNTVIEAKNVLINFEKTGDLNKELLLPLAEKAKTMTKEEFVTQFEKGLIGQNLTVQQTARNVQELMKAHGIESPAKFYDSVTKQSNSIPDHSLIQEAQKYKSAEEFVKAQGEQLYHGSKVKGFTEFDAKFQPTDDAPAFFFTPDKKDALRYAANVEKGGGDVVGARVDTSKFYNATQKEWSDGLDYNKLKSEGYTGIKIAPPLEGADSFTKNAFGDKPTYAVFDTKNIKIDNVQNFTDALNNTPTKSQLTDIWNKANKPVFTSKQKISELPQEQSKAVEPLKPQALEEKIPQQIQPSKEGGMQESVEVVGSESLPTGIPQDFNPDKYVKEQIAKREKARLSEKPTIRGKVKKFLANAKKKLVDFSAPIEDILAETVKKNKIKLAPEDDIHNQIDRVLRAPTIAGEFARQHGLVDVIKTVDNVENFDQYLIAKHAIELDARKIETGRDIAKDKALVEAFKGKYEETAQKVSEYSRKLLDYTTGSGLISQGVADLLKQRYPDHVPFNRIFNELEKTDGFKSSGGIASLSKQDIVQRIEGSSREVESSLESLLAKTNDAFRQGEKNKAAQILASYKDLPDNPFQLRELEKGETAKHTISYLEDGVKKTYETTKEVAEAAKALNVQQMNILGKIFALPVRVARIGITGINFPFVAANIAKDQVSAFINSNHSLATSLANPTNFIKSLFSAVSHDKLYKEMVSEGGGGTSFDIAREQVSKTLKQIRAGRSIKSKILYTVKNPLQLLRAVEDIVAISEEFTRIQQYRGTKGVLLKKGLSEKSAKTEAARSARENTVNFARRGEWLTVLNSVFLYLNASIQGTRTLLRNLKNKPIQTSAKIAIAALFPVATVTVWNLSDPKRKAAYEDIPEFEKENNLIIIPPNPTKDANGKWNVIKIPISQEINSLVGLARRPIEAARGMSPLEFKDFFHALIGTVSPVEPTKGSLFSTFTPQAIKPAIEVTFNKIFFTGFPIVPQSMENLSPEKQFKDGTSGSARKIGKLLNVSPLKVETFIKETFGGVGSQAVNFVDQVLYELGVIPEDQIGGQNVLDAITARFNKAAGGAVEQKEIEEIKKLTTKQADAKADIKNEAETKWTELKLLPKDQAAIEFGKLIKENPVLAKKISDIATEEKKGITVTDRFIMQLQVTNGERAKYLAEQFNALSTKEEKAKLWQEYVKKGIISANVAEQLSSLLNK